MWLLVEDKRGPSLPLLSDDGCFLGLEFRPETTPETAAQIANLLNEHVQFLTYTGPIRPEWADQPGRGAVARRKRRRLN